MRKAWLDLAEQLRCDPKDVAHMQHTLSNALASSQNAAQVLGVSIEDAHFPSLVKKALLSAPKASAKAGKSPKGAARSKASNEDANARPHAENIVNVNIPKYFNIRVDDAFTDTNGKQYIIVGYLPMSPVYSIVARMQETEVLYTYEPVYVLQRMNRDSSTYRKYVIKDKGASLGIEKSDVDRVFEYNKQMFRIYAIRPSKNAVIALQNIHHTQSFVEVSAETFAKVKRANAD